MVICRKLNRYLLLSATIMPLFVSLVTSSAAGHLRSGLGLGSPCSLGVNTAEPGPWESPVIVPLPAAAAAHSYFMDRSYRRLRILYQNHFRCSVGLNCLSDESQQKGPDTVQLPPLSLYLSHSLCPGVLFIINSLRGLEAVFAQVRFADVLNIADCDLVLSKNGASSASNTVVRDRITHFLTRECLGSVSTPALAKMAAIFCEPVREVNSMTAEEMNAVFRQAGGFSPGTVDHLAEVSPLVLAVYHFGFFCTLFVLLSSIPRIISVLERHNRMVLATFSMNRRRKAQTPSRSRATVTTLLSRAGETILMYFDSISETIWCLSEWLE